MLILMDYERYISEKVKILPPSGIRKFFDIVNEVKGCISLGIGEPDFDTPQDIRDEAIRKVRSGFTQYTSNWGMASYVVPMLRQRKRLKKL